jgi:hypothetical protein
MAKWPTASNNPAIKPAMQRFSLKGFLKGACAPLLCATRDSVQPILYTASLFHAREQAPA